MKKIIYILAAVSFLSACSTEEEKPVTNAPSSKLETLTGATSKKWGLVKLYINDTLFPLSSDQLLYAKTYNRDSTFLDTDGIGGRFNLSSDAKYLTETVNTGGSGLLVYKINALSTSSIDYKLIYNGTDSLNTRFIFNAK